MANIKASVELSLEPQLEGSEDQSKSKITSLMLDFCLSSEFDKSMYFNQNGTLTAVGLKSLTMTLVHGLAANMLSGKDTVSLEEQMEIISKELCNVLEKGLDGQLNITEDAY